MKLTSETQSGNTAKNERAVGIKILLYYLLFFILSLFSIDISPLLSLPIGSIEEFHFEQEIPRDTWPDLVCEEPLSMHIKLLRQEYGINCLLLRLESTISIPSEGLEQIPVVLEDISREFHLKKRNEDTDDIEYIDTHDVTIDLSRVIEQELLIAGL